MIVLYIYTYLYIFLKNFAINKMLFNYYIVNSVVRIICAHFQDPPIKVLISFSHSLFQYQTKTVNFYRKKL